jgi:hypothetical protein
MNVFRAALARDFWITGIAIARYIPRAFRVKQVDGSQFFTEEKRQEYRRRVESVTPNSRRQWGTMEVDQMLHHLNLACGGSQGFYDLPDESYLISRTIFKWILVDWYPEQPVGLRLPTGFKIPHSQRFEFAYEKSQLLKILEVDWNARTEDAWNSHPMFGKMTPTEWGKLLQISQQVCLLVLIAEKACLGGIGLPKDEVAYWTKARILPRSEERIDLGPTVEHDSDSILLQYPVGFAHGRPEPVGIGVVLYRAAVPVSVIYQIGWISEDKVDTVCRHVAHRGRTGGRRS